MYILGRKLKLKRAKDRTFSIALAEIRMEAAMVNAVLIIVALGLNAGRLSYLIAGSYFSLNLLLWLFPQLKRAATRSLRFPLFVVDMAVTGYMIAVTGGSTSELYPFLFIPVMLAILRCKYFGIFSWCTAMALILTAGSLYSGTFHWNFLLLKISYLYLAGITGGYLMRQTYSLKEEISKTLTRWNIDLQRLNSFSQEVTGSSDLNEIFNRIIKAVRQTGSLKMVAVMMFDDELLKIYDFIDWDEAWVAEYNKHPLGKQSLTLAPIIVFREPLLCRDIKKHPELTKVFQGIPIASLFAFPLVISGEVIGALVVTSQTIQFITDQEKQILNSIANQASIAIQNAVNLSQEKQKADTDGLTGLYNRRYFNEQIEALASEAIANEEPLSLILIDIDNFKKYNDTYGHPAGDQLLKTVTAAITEVTREQDIFARYGGEEFAVILKDTSNRLARHIAERIRLVVERIPPGVLKCPVTISAGVGTLPDFAKDGASLMEFTDKSLYRAKNSGKNRVCCGY